MPSYPYMRTERRRMLVARHSTNLAWVAAASRAHTCGVESGPTRTARIAMVEALAFGFGLSAGIIWEWLEAIEQRFSTCPLCLTAHLFTSEEPSPPVWFVRAFKATLPLGNEPPSRNEVAVLHHLIWAALYIAGVRSQDDALRRMAEPRP